MKKKSLSAKKKIHKKLIKYLKNPRINKIYKDFEKSLIVNKDLPKKASEENGPETLNPLFLNFITIGFIISSSSFPINPLSPMCGFNPKTATLGQSIKKSFFKLLVQNFSC